MLFEIRHIETKDMENVELDIAFKLKNADEIINLGFMLDAIIGYSYNQLYNMDATMDDILKDPSNAYLLKFRRNTQFKEKINVQLIPATSPIQSPNLTNLKIVK